MRCDSWASLLASTLISPCFGREPKVKVVTICTLIGEELLISPQFCAHPISAKITSPQTQGSQGYVANMDAQIIISNNIATFFSTSKLPNSDGNFKPFIKILRTYGLISIR
jgi:hypothetical protein